MHKPTIERPHPIGNGVQKIYRFKNGYGASVVQFNGSYGYEKGLWELAVIEFYDKGINDYHLTYETPVTDDVIGYLTIDEVEKTLDKIEALPIKKS